MTSQEERQANELSKCLGSLKLWKELIEGYLDGEEKAAEIGELEEIVKEYCLIDFNASRTAQACQEVVDHFNENGDDSKNVDELYQEKLAEKQTNFAVDYEQHRIWKQIFQGVRMEMDVEEIEQNEDTEEAEYEEMRDSIYYSNVFTPPVDPISKKVIEDPYKNRKCGHLYEYKFILQYIKGMKNKAKCPYMGCSNKNLIVADLVEDKSTKEKIVNYQSQSQASASSSNEA